MDGKTVETVKKKFKLAYFSAGIFTYYYDGTSVSARRKAGCWAWNRLQEWQIMCKFHSQYIAEDQKLQLLGHSSISVVDIDLSDDKFNLEDCKSFVCIYVTSYTVLFTFYVKLTLYIVFCLFFI